MPTGPSCLKLENMEVIPNVHGTFPAKRLRRKLTFMNYLEAKDRKMFSRAAKLVRVTLTKMKSKKIIGSEWDTEWPYRSATLFFAAKSFKSYQAIRVLCARGFFQDAAVLTRTIFEIYLQAKYMAGDPLQRAEMFKNHDIADRYFKYLKLAKYPELVDAIEKRPEELTKLKAQFAEIEREYKKNTGWWGKDLRWLAENNQEEKSYLTVYPFYSGLVHSTSSSVKYYLLVTEKLFGVDFEPSPRGSEILGAFPLATGCVRLTASIAAAAWKFKEDMAEMDALAHELAE